MATNTPTNTPGPDDIRANIEATRANMTETLDAIQARLNPQRLMEQARDTVQGAVHDATVGRAEDAVAQARDAMSDLLTPLLDTIKRNPLPAALVAMGLGWVASQGRRASSNASHAATNARYAASNAAANAQMTATQVATQARDGAGQLADQASVLADQAREQIGQLGEQAGVFANQTREQAEQQAQRAGMWVQHNMEENPLAIGAIALALGAALGLSLPSTEQEHHLMGETRDQLVQRAQDAAQEALERVHRVAAEAQSAAERAAREEGLLH